MRRVTSVAPFCCRSYSKCPRLLQCVARNKYAKDDPGADWQGPGLVILDRTVLYFDQGQVSEDAFIRALRKIEVLANAGGIYTTNPRDSGSSKPEHSIPLAWMVVYITACPLDEDEAADAFVSKVFEHTPRATTHPCHGPSPTRHDTHCAKRRPCSISIPRNRIDGSNWTWTP